MGSITTVRQGAIATIARTMVLALLLVTPARAGLEAGTPVASPSAAPATVLPPDAKVDGLTLGEWHARYWQWFISLLTPALDPSSDPTGERCTTGQHGAVFFLSYAGAPRTDERTCPVPAGVPLFVPMQEAECSTGEPAPFHGETEADLRTCAAEHIDIGLEQDLPDNRLVVDGQTIDLTPYRAPSPAFWIVWPAGNVVGIPAQVSLSVADGYAVLVAGLSEGAHTIELDVPDGAGHVGHVTYHLIASSGAATS